jgi:hypothetical protein
LVEAEVCSRLGVEPKTVQRWLNGWMPLRQHRWALVDLVGRPEHELWPELVDGRAKLPCPEIQTVYPHRTAVPRELWRRILASAGAQIGILVYAGLFLAEDVELLRVLVDRARAGVTVRVLLGDPDSAEVARRGAEEGIGDAMAAKIRNAMVFYQPLIAAGAAEVRLHSTVLYNSIFRGDDEMLVNSHVYGTAAASAPVVHLRRAIPGDLVDTYAASFERVWDSAEAPS